MSVRLRYFAWVRERVGHETEEWPLDAPMTVAALVEQLVVGGRMLIPLGDRASQQLTLVTRQADRVVREAVVECTFVPLIGRFGWHD